MARVVLLLLAAFGAAGCETWKHAGLGLEAPIGPHPVPSASASASYLLLPLFGASARASAGPRGATVAVGVPVYGGLVEAGGFDVGLLASVYALQLGWLDGAPAVGTLSPEVVAALLLPEPGGDRWDQRYIAFGVAAGFDWYPSAQPSQLWTGIRVGVGRHERTRLR